MSFYNALLRLYPRSFRAEYGPELIRTFQESVRDRGKVAAAIAALFDVVPNALAAHGRILAQDLRYARRTLSRSPGFALTVVMVTALGVGANTAVFTVTDFVLLRPLPFREPEALVRICEGPKEGGGWGCMNELSPANYRDVTKASQSFETVGVFAQSSVNLVGSGDPVRLQSLLVSAQVIPLLGVTPLLGRLFDTTAARDRDNQSVVLGYGLWQSRFGGDFRVLGQTIQLGGRPMTVIGVMPQGFHFPSPDVQLWMPLVLTEDDFSDRTNTYLHGIARLKHGVSFEQARGDINTLAARFQKDYPETNAETGFSFFRLRDADSPRYRVMLLALSGASLALLLLTSANLANLLLARASNRERELAVRAALGAGRERLVRQMLTESIVLALIGGVVGLLVAVLAMPLLSYLIPTSLPQADRPGVDLRTLALAGSFTALIGIGFGLLPALRVGGKTGFSALREGARSGGRRQRLRTVLVTAEVSISVALLISSGFLIRAVMRVNAVDPGFSPESVLAMRTELPSPRYDEPIRRNEFYRQVLEKVSVLPGVRAAAYTSGLPMVLTGGIAGVEVPGQEVPNRRTSGVGWRFVTPQYFRVLEIPMVQGREIEEADGPDRPLVAVVSESFVNEYWPGENPIGKTFRVQARDTLINPPRTVVGVVRDIKVRGLERTAEPQLYLPARQMPPTVGGLYPPKELVVRTSARGSNILPQVREIIRGVDPEQPISDVRLLSEVVERQTASRRAQLQVLGALSLIALLLTGVGIHGLLAFLVAQRAREIGVRLALGAERGRVAAMIVKEAGLWTLIGCIPGVFLAYAAAKGMQALLFGIGPSDPVTMGLGLVVVLVVSLAGSLLPALRAVRISPLLAMRTE